MAITTAPNFEQEAVGVASITSTATITATQTKYIIVWHPTSVALAATPSGWTKVIDDDIDGVMSVTLYWTTSNWTSAASYTLLASADYRNYIIAWTQAVGLNEARDVAPNILYSLVTSEARTPAAPDGTVVPFTCPQIGRLHASYFLLAVSTVGSNKVNSASGLTSHGADNSHENTATADWFSIAFYANSTAGQIIDPTVDCDIGAASAELYALEFWIPENTNTVPSVPTGLTRTSAGSDTTPVFEASLDDFDFLFSEQAKIRFQVLTSGMVAINTVDSSFRSSAGVASAEYTSALAVGNYNVRAKTIDDDAAESAYSAALAFSIRSLIQKDIEFLYHVKENLNKDIEFLYNTQSSSTAQKDLSLLFNVERAVPTPVEKDLEFLFEVSIGWQSIEVTDTIWVPVEPPSYA
jgi:hypothetical protein